MTWFFVWSGGRWCVSTQIPPLPFLLRFLKKTVLPGTGGTCVHQSQADTRHEGWGLLRRWKGRTDSCTSSRIRLSLSAQHTATEDQPTVTPRRNFWIAVKYSMQLNQVMSRKHTTERGTAQFRGQLSYFWNKCNNSNNIYDVICRCLEFLRLFII